MHIEQLVIMANDIANFFHGASEPGTAPKSVSDHLRRYWYTSMRRQIIAYNNAGGAGLSDIARAGVRLLESGASDPNKATAGSSQEVSG